MLTLLFIRYYHKQLLLLKQQLFKILVLQKLRELYNTVHNIGAVDAAARNTTSTAVTTTSTTTLGYNANVTSAASIT
jgi:hypothetical protein